jgi:small subunit ribosomal protein S18
MASKKNKARTSRDLNPRKFKKKTSILLIEDVEYIDYKDVDLLSRFMSDRGKIRNRRVAGNTLQQQREVANAVKVAREMALLPYAKRVASTRTGGRREGRDGGGRDGRPGRDESSNEEATLTLEGTTVDGVDATEFVAASEEA